jgi:ornithine cyclodeaminase
MGAHTELIYIDFDETHRLAKVAGLIEPVLRAFVGQASSPERAHYEIEEGERSRTLLVMPAWRAEGAIGIKTVTVFPDNHRQGLPTVTGLYVLLSWQTGEPLAVIDGRALTLLRTAAVSALAAKLLAPLDAERLLFVGTGALSSYLIRGHAAVRNYRSIEVWGRDARKAAAVVSALGDLGLSITVAGNLEEAARKADVISCATTAEQPFLEGAWLKPSCHLDLVGSFKPNMRESNDDCLLQASIVVDTMDSLEESGDLIGPLAKGVFARSEVQLLQAIAANNDHSRARGRTVFKSVGVAHADLAVAEQLFAKYTNRSDTAQD